MAMSKVRGTKVKAPSHESPPPMKSKKLPAGRGGFVPGMRGAPKSMAKQKNFSK